MQKIKTKTMFGVIKDENGEIICKCVFDPVKEHPLRDGFTFEEIGSKEAFDAVKVESPVEKETIRAQVLGRALAEVGEELLVKQGKMDPKNGEVPKEHLKTPKKLYPRKKEK